MNTWWTANDIRIPWIQYPFVRICIPFISGILASDLIAQMYGPLFIALASFISMIILDRRIKAHLNLSFVFGIGHFLFFASVGIIWSQVRNEKNLPNHFSINTTAEGVYKIYSKEEKNKYWDCYCQAKAMIEKNIVQHYRGNILIRIPLAYSYVPEVGDILQCKSKITEPPGASAPFEFDWKNVLHHKNIHSITYADTNQFKIIFKAKPSLLSRIRDLTDKKIKEAIPNIRDYPVASAMIVGLRKQIDPELFRAYSATGAVHILAVSGMHVMIIATLLEFIIGKLPGKLRMKKSHKTMIIIVMTWLYTFFTGATPSIVRSALMFTLFQCGRMIQRHSTSINILSMTAFVLLMLNPMDVYNIGFQLSFGAMAGIFILYEPIRTVWIIKQKWLQEFWKMMSVSLSAQLFIYPVVGLYFHQFAFYFWLTGLVSGPLSYAVIITGLVAISLSQIHFDWVHWFYLPFQWSVKIMNEMIIWVYKLPFGRLAGWWPSGLDVIILIIISLLMAHYLENRTSIALKLFMTAWIILFSVLSIENYILRNKKEIVATRFRNKTVAWLKWKDAFILFDGDTGMICNDYIAAYGLKPENTLSALNQKINFRKFNLDIMPKTVTIKSNQFSTDDSSPAKNLLLFQDKKYNPEMKFLRVFIPSYSTLPQNDQIIKSKNAFIQIPVK